MAFELEQSGELESLAAAVDLPQELAEEAVSRYESVAEWLAQDDSPLAAYEPEIYPQGSFRLGTPIRALRRNDEFDIDLVCRLTMRKDQTTQKQLKESVGNRLRAGASKFGPPSPRRRCWTLSYPERQFHLDVLPAIPSREIGDGSHILLTDRDLREWQHSNPIGYANWFFQRMTASMRVAKAALAVGASIEDVPEWRVRTPLQRTVQLLKRHRDIYFEGSDDNRPVSIIITTLAGHAYQEQTDLRSALVGVSSTMDRYIERRADKWWIANPAHPQENFADKWNESPERKVAFDRWLQTLRLQITGAQRATRPEDARSAIAKGFRPARPLDPRRWVQKAIAPLGDQGHCESPPWSLALTHKCSLRASVHTSVNGGKRLWALGGPVQKGLGLKFELSTNVPQPYAVYWQVVNTGSEAQASRDLRGKLEQASGGTGVRWEVAKYAGTHWVEAFVVRNGSCLARSGRTFVKVRP